MTTDEAAEMAALPTQLRDDAGYLERVAPGGWYIEMANRLRRAATFIERSTAPTGEMVMVPREPTDEMLWALDNEWPCPCHLEQARVAYRAMLSSSPHPTPEGEGPFTATHRQVRTGATYMVVAHGNDCTNKNAKLVPVVIYRNQYGAWWVREAAEFEDGRFQRMIEPPSVPEPFATPDAIRRAVDAERERCAQIAVYWQGDESPIAAAIRSRNEG